MKSKYLLLFLLIGIGLQSAVGQTPDKITVSPNSKLSLKASPPSEKFKTAAIDKNGIGSLSLPENMIAAPIKEEKFKNADGEWTNYKYEWKTPVSKSTFEPLLRAEIWTRIVPGLPAESAAALEYLIQADHAGNLKAQKEFGDLTGGQIKEIELMNLDGTNGSYALFTKNNGSIFVAAWQTYVIFDGNVKMVSVTIEGDPKEIPKAKQILKSFKFAAK